MTAHVGDTIQEALNEIGLYRDAKQAALDRLALEVLRARNAGETVRGLAERYDVTPSAIHAWTQRGRHLTETGSRPQRRRVPDSSPVAILPASVQWLLLAMIIACFALHIADRIW